MTAVATWRATNTTVISARLRCSARVAKRGSAPSATRPQVAMPSAITAGQEHEGDDAACPA